METSLSPTHNYIHFSAPTSPPACKFDQLRGRIIVLEGIMGSGKSLLGRSISYYLNARGIPARMFEEYVNKDLLDLYLSNPSKYAFAFQSIMVMKRIDRYEHEILPYVASGGVAIIDRFILGDISFERMGHQLGTISDEENRVYWAILNHLDALPRPDYQVFLECSPVEALERIRTRGNQSEIQSYKLDDLIILADIHSSTFRHCAAKITHIEYSNRLKIKPDGYLRWQDVRGVLKQILRL